MERVSRRRSLLIRELGTETLVYDMKSHRASCLNREAASVFRACNGHRTIAEIALNVGEALGREVDEHYIGLAISRLSQSGLVDTASIPESPRRRELLRRVAATAAVALPTITSVLAPAPAEAQSCVLMGLPCTMDSECCSGMCQMNQMLCVGQP